MDKLNVTDGPEIWNQIANHDSLIILITSNIYLALISNIFLIINLIINAPSLGLSFNSTIIRNKISTKDEED